MIKTKQTVLMSIKPKYVDQIVSKKKLFEFRRAVFNANNVDKVVIYASSPIKKIVAEFNVTDIIKDTPENIWERCKKHAGIDRNSFLDYFADKQMAFSIVIDNLKVYDKPINPYKELDGFRPPQSYMFLDTKLESVLSGSISA